MMRESTPNYLQARCDLHPEHPLAWLSPVQLQDDDGGPSKQLRRSVQSSRVRSILLRGEWVSVNLP